MLRMHCSVSNLGADLQSFVNVTQLFGDREQLHYPLHLMELIVLSGLVTILVRLMSTII